nr:hypothetical protein B0A51_04131 [Rachicladosporium sp. CCFEE 5018]
MANISSNPLVDPPTFAPPARPLRSASHSPVRRQVSYGRHIDADPLLRDLSPTVALRAFGQTRAASPRADALAKCFEHTPDSRRVLGQRAAGFCVDVRAWVREVEGWEWDDEGGFEEVRERKRRRVDVGDEVWERHGEDEEEVEWWGSLPRRTVEGYEHRIVEIERGVEDVDVEELKGFVRVAHQDAEDGSKVNGNAAKGRKLDDYTTVVTATILKALPYLSRLNKLLDVWTTRLWILRQVPGFLDGMKQARSELGGAWDALKPSASESDASGQRKASENDHLLDLQTRLEDRITSLGRRLDNLLDETEGGAETLPERWIEDFEHFEQKYSEWREQVERTILDRKLVESRAADHEARRLSKDLTPDDHFGGSTDQSTDVRIHASNGAQLVTASTIPQENVTDMEAMIDSAIIDVKHLSAEPTPAASSGPETGGCAHATEIKLVAHPYQPKDTNEDHLEPSDALRNVVTITKVSDEPSAPEAGANPRHVFDAIPSTGHGDDHLAADVPSRSVSTSSVPANIMVKKRAAFLSDAERTSSLQRATKSPVRSFEHASNAFTRLFKKDKPEEVSRSSSAASRRTLSGKERTSSLTNGDREVVAPAGVNTVGPAEEAHAKGVMLSGAGTAPLESRADTPSSPEAVMLDVKSTPSTKMNITGQHSNSSPAVGHERETEPDTTVAPAKTEDWPLASPVASPHAGTTPAQVSPIHETAPVPAPGLPSLHHELSDNSTEIHSPGPLDSNAFDRMFVDSLPATPDERNATSAARRGSTGRAGSPSGLRRSIEWLDEQKALAHKEVRSASLSDREALSADLIDQSNTNETEHHAKSQNDSPRDLQQLHDQSSPESPLSAMSSPEIRDASIGYFPLQSPTASQRNSVAAVTPLQNRSISTPLASPLHLRLRIPGLHGEIDNDDLSVRKPLMVKRASMTSIESHSRSELRSIDLSKRRPTSVLQSKSSSPAEHSQSPIGQQSFAAFPVPPSGHVPSVAEESAAKDDASEGPSPVSPLEESPVLPRTSGPMPKRAAAVADSSPAAQKADLNALMGKRRQPPAATLTPQKKKPAFKTPTKHDAASFDRHVSSVLEALPAPIKFRSNPRSSPRNASDPRPKTPRLVSQTKSSGLTLAPAELDAKKSQSAADPEVKLYHLTQAGREEQPIRLFVRLVGENERVMVRVGGGWADLADYLRQYAEHHGSRTVSGGREVDVSTLASAGTSSRKVSGAAARQTPIPGSRPGSNDSAATPVSPETSSSPTPANYTSTPNRSSRPSTADSLASRTAFASANNSGKKADLPEHKAKWIEGMLEKVTKASAEKARGDKGVVGEIGKAGATRRVIFRSSSALGGVGKK